MEKLNELKAWEFPDRIIAYGTVYVEEHYYVQSTSDNMLYLMDRHNDLVRFVNVLVDKLPK